ncbi:MAG: RNA polymerase sigma factor [Corticimicrobacter sp.]|uniref:RNA polymerase sigma factor n=1 Tax=Corticimicrobacter sp. TaxID=2678536 RepID=UPI0032DAEC76
MSTPTATPILAALIRHYDALVGHIQTRFGCRHFAQDVVQDVSVDLLTTPRQAIRQPRAFLYRLATHQAIDHWRSQRARQAALEQPAAQHWLQPEATPNPHEALESLQTEARLIQCLASLPLRCQEVFSLHVLHQVPQTRVADMLGISRTMVARHLERAHAAIREVLDHAA